MKKIQKVIQKQPVLQLLSGILLCLLIILVGIYGAGLIGKMLIAMKVLPAGSASPISGIFVAILIGVLIRNTIGLHELFASGVAFSLKYALRGGIILLGLRLSLAEAFTLGAWGLPLIVVCISIGLLITIYFTKKMGQSERLGTLIATGTGICGVTAIMAISPVIKAKDNEISYAVANITVFGLIGMLLYPYLAHFFFADEPIKAGLFLGTAIHDTAQVTGAGLIYSQMFTSPQVIDIATVTKLTRNLFIIVVIPLLSFLFFRESKEGSQNVPKWYQLIPLFVMGFLFLAFIRTMGDMTVANQGLAFGFLSPENWASLYEHLSSFGSTYLLGMAMAGVGLSTDFRMFKGLGLKPFSIGLIAALAVGLMSLILVSLFGDFVVL